MILHPFFDIMEFMKGFWEIIKKIVSNFWVQLVFLLGCVVGIFALGGVFNSPESMGEKFIEIVTSVDVISILLAAVFSITVARIVLKVKKVTEEAHKIEQDHHKIVCKYSGHSKALIDTKNNLYKKEGEFMYLERLPEKKKKPKNPYRDKTTDDYISRRKDIQSYMDGRLFLPILTIYTNTCGNTSVCVNDSKKKYELPTFVRENVLGLMEAHFVSKTSNNDTIRLNDISCVGTSLTLYTMRTQYLDMLVTNRCMDYALDGVISIRDIYEYEPRVTPLKDSQLSNQIGINGLIITKDGYLLLEKRGRKKAVWKDKFAQPISLAMKKNDLLDPDKEIGDGYSDAEETFKKTVLKTVKKNFGLTEKELLPFTMKTNFLGIARDLLEGGKPNFYFFVVADMSAERLKEFVERKSKAACMRAKEKDLPALNKDKLESDFYLIDYKDITIDYNYELKIKMRRMLRIKRRYAPVVSKFKQAFDGAGFRIRRAFGGSIRKGCGEALLSSLYYVDACCERLYGRKGD